MKPLAATKALLNLAWWHEHAISVMQTIGEYQMHKRPEQFKRAANQVIEAASLAEKWHNEWLKTFPQTA